MADRVHIWDSVESMLADCDKAFQAGKRATTTEDCLQESAGWIGRYYGSWSEVVADANGAWPYGQKLVAEMIEQLAHVKLPQPVSLKRRPRWSEDGGDEICMDRVRSGQGDCWRTMSRQSTQATKTIAIVVNDVASGSKESSDILWRGAAGVVLANILENAGYRVEFWACDYGCETYEDGQGNFQAVCLKRAEQPLDAATIINAVSGWFFRVLFFSRGITRMMLSQTFRVTATR